jgi:spermidine synthase
MQWPPLPDLPLADTQPHTQLHVKPFVCDDGSAKSLHFTMGELQSRMNKASPWQLDVDYTRTMMGFLLLRNAPAHIVMVGLGGGSLAKFCHRQLPDCRLTVVEINPHVIALRRDFSVPDDDERFQVILGDGAAFVAAQPPRCDVLLVDGFDHEGQPAALCSQRFYDDCFAALTQGGVLAVNLHHDDADYPVWAERIQRSFSGNAVEVPAPEKTNCIVFASRGAPLSPRRVNLTSSLSRLDSAARQQLKPEFARITWHMKDLDDSVES